jgi:hypothetical protein
VLPFVHRVARLHTVGENGHGSEDEVEFPNKSSDHSSLILRWVTGADHQIRHLSTETPELLDHHAKDKTPSITAAQRRMGFARPY